MCGGPEDIVSEGSYPRDGKIYVRKRCTVCGATWDEVQ